MLRPDQYSNVKPSYDILITLSTELSLISVQTQHELSL